MKESKRLEYEFKAKHIYKNFKGLRLTDAQLAKLITEEFGGVESTHNTNIRRSGCNIKTQPYIDIKTKK